MVDLVFFVDIIINFRTSYIDGHGEEIIDPQLISAAYLFHPRFIIDLLSTIPLSEFL